MAPGGRGGHAGGWIKRITRLRVGGGWGVEYVVYTTHNLRSTVRNITTTLTAEPTDPEEFPEPAKPAKPRLLLYGGG